MRFPEPGNPTVSSPRAVYSWEPRLIDAIPVGLRRESSSPIPRVQWPRRQFTTYLLNNNNVLQDPYDIPVETTHKADTLRMWHRRPSHGIIVAAFHLLKMGRIS